MSPLIVLLAVQAQGKGWQPRDVAYPQEMARVRFALYLPRSTKGFRVQRFVLAWVPKLKEYPGRPARQAARITLATKEGGCVYLIETPTLAISNYANIGQLLGQGYLARPLRKGDTVVARQKGRTCVGLISHDLGAEQLNELSGNLNLVNGQRLLQTHK